MTEATPRLPKTNWPSKKSNQGMAECHQKYVFKATGLTITVCVWYMSSLWSAVHAVICMKMLLALLGIAALLSALSSAWTTVTGILFVGPILSTTCHLVLGAGPHQSRATPPAMSLGVNLSYVPVALCPYTNDMSGRLTYLFGHPGYLAHQARRLPPNSERVFVDEQTWYRLDQGYATMFSHRSACRSRRWRKGTRDSMSG
ncbi:hypothetical protein LZ30DRAFT_731349 [Colletotrichum cereale]|nr:hypothetical protein LZ30DRAFT_731349 [Colletotrichum cereale]